jgi:excisionase family DNA binding protein
MDMSDLTIKTNDLVTFTEAARILDVSRPTIYNLVLKQQLHPVLIGRNRYLLRTEIEALIDGQSSKGHS